MKIVKPTMMRKNETMKSEVIYGRISKKEYEPVPFSKDQFCLNKNKGKRNPYESLFVVPWQQIR